MAVLCGGRNTVLPTLQSKRAGNALGVIGAPFSLCVHVVRGERGDPLHVE